MRAARRLGLGAARSLGALRAAFGDRWVSAREVATELRRQGLTRNQGARDVGALVAAGRLEREGPWGGPYRYRVAPWAP